MKKLITLASLLIVLTAHSQTRTGLYSKIITDNWKANDMASSKTVFKTGTLKVTKDVILVDSATDKPQCFKIVDRGVIDDYDYGEYIQLLTVIFPTKTGIKAQEVILYIGKDRKTITDVIFKHSPHSYVCYTFK